MGGPARAAGEKPNVPAADRTFLDDTYSINAGEIMLGQLAEQRGTTPPVMTFARHMISDHTKALDASRHVASKVHLVLPADVDAPTKALYNELSGKSGRDFDTAYIDAMVSGHEAAVRRFEQEEKNGQNATIKGYARDELPMIREHLSLARKAQQEQTGVAEPQKP
jgi:putative membrane protein